MGWSDSGDTSDFSEYCMVGSDSHANQRKDEKQHPCTYNGCRLVFSRPFRLAAHICVHTGEKPFPCKWDGCKKAYTNKSHLSRHVKSVHEKTVPSKLYSYHNSTHKQSHREATRILHRALSWARLQCPPTPCSNPSALLRKSRKRCSKCTMNFATSQNLKKHVQRLHECKYDYYCDICQTGFKKKNILAQHMFYHTGCDPFQCQICDKSFSELNEFNKHKRNHKTFQCFCKQVFTRWSDMVKHKKFAHAPSEFICDYCQKVFKSRIQIVKHVKSHLTQRLVYPCTYDGCPKFYSSKYNLTFHIQSYHENLTFNCTKDGCNAKLSTKAKLLFHLYKHDNPNDANKKNKVPRQRNKRKDVGVYKKTIALKIMGVKLPANEEINTIESNMNCNEMMDIDHES